MKRKEYTKLLFVVTHNTTSNDTFQRRHTQALILLIICKLKLTFSVSYSLE